MEAVQANNGLEVWCVAGVKKHSSLELKEALENSRSIRQALLKLGLKPAVGNYATAHRLIRDLGIDISHMKGQGWSRGMPSGIPSANKIPLEEILVKDSTYTSSDKLRKRLIDNGLKAVACESCHLDSWMGRTISLELNHVNGDRFDHRLENLQLLCPNCHAQTPNYRGKNIGNKGSL
jgi:hypothetical protein